MCGRLLFMVFFLSFGFADAQSDSLLKANNPSNLDSNFTKEFFDGTPWSDYLDSVYTQDLISQSNFTYFNECENVHCFAKDSVPVWHDSILKNRLEALNAQTPINLDYNQTTRKFLVFYANKRRLMVSRVLGLQQLYYPLFEEELEKEGLPIELKHLAVVESALTPDIRSHAGATGLWQFMYRTGKYFGLNINSYVDERMDPEASTKTAVRYLKYLHGLYDDWHLALAAYNAGPGNVNKAIRRSGGKKTYWGIYPYLPRETRGYVPAFIAVNYIMNHAADHNIYARKPKYLAAELDTVEIHKAVSFAQISEITCITEEELTYLNPQYKIGIIPQKKEGKSNYFIVLPRAFVGNFITLEQDIYEYKLPHEINQEETQVEQIANRKKIIHRVRSGESIGLIAQKYKVTKTEIREWNNLKRRGMIHPGQKLTVYSSKRSRSRRSNKKAIVKNRNGYLYHTIRNGDTLWDIANKYKGVSVSSIRRLNKFRKNHVLKPGDKIKIKST